MQESIFSALMSEKDACFDDIYKTKLPSKMCPFGCKKTKCPYDWDASKCPHNLDEKSIDELVEYMIKAFYFGDESKDIDYTGSVDPKVAEFWKKFQRPGNYGRNRQNNPKV